MTEPVTNITINLTTSDVANLVVQDFKAKTPSKIEELTLQKMDLVAEMMYLSFQILTVVVPPFVQSHSAKVDALIKAYADVCQLEESLSSLTRFEVKTVSSYCHDLFDRESEILKKIEDKYGVKLVHLIEENTIQVTVPSIRSFLTQQFYTYDDLDKSKVHLEIYIDVEDPVNNNFEEQFIPLLECPPYVEVAIPENVISSLEVLQNLYEQAKELRKEINRLSKMLKDEKELLAQTNAAITASKLQNATGLLQEVSFIGASLLGNSVNLLPNAAEQPQP